MSSTHQKHQRYILRRFSPFLSDEMLDYHEKVHLAFLIAWSALVLLPTILAAITCDYFLREPLFYFSVLMMVFVLARAFVWLN
jgi:hypothetical protein